MASESDDTDGQTEDPEDPEYPVERILAQYADNDGSPLYLVRWRGYFDEKCTWEPPESFEGSSILEDWEEQRAAGGLLTDDEIAALQARMDAYNAAEAVNSDHNAADSDQDVDSDSGRDDEQDLFVAEDRPAFERAHDEASTVPEKSSRASRSKVPVQKRDHGATKSKSKSGERFKNPRHQKNFAKLARVEPAPDAANLGLRSPDDWEKSSPVQKSIEPHRALRRHDPGLGCAGRSLEHQNVGAAWALEGSNPAFLVILYSSHAPGWRHLGRIEANSFASRLHVFFRELVPGVSPCQFLVSLENAVDNAVESRCHIVELPRGHADLCPRITDSTLPTVQALHIPSSESRSSSSQLQSRSTPQTLNSPSNGRHRTTTDLGGQECNVEFLDGSTKLFGIFGSPKTTPMFYIAFARSHRREADAVSGWLQSKGIDSRYIYSNAKSRYWEDFCSFLKVRVRPGIAMFHRDQPNFWDLPYFCRYVSPTTGLTCFELAFASRKGASKLRVSASRLFPAGAAILVTEASLLKYPADVLSAMRWFEKSSRNFPANWKLCLIRQAPKLAEEDLPRYDEILTVFGQLEPRPRDRRNRDRKNHEQEMMITRTFLDDEHDLLLSLSGSDRDMGHANVDMSDSVVQVRDRALAESFIAWAAVNAAKYRKFVALDDVLRNKSISHSWHVWIRPRDDFLRGQRSKSVTARD